MTFTGFSGVRVYGIGGAFSLLASVFEEYFSRLKTLQGKTDTQFEKIENLFKLHFQLITEMPDEMALIASYFSQLVEA